MKDLLYTLLWLILCIHGCVFGFMGFLFLWVFVAWETSVKAGMTAGAGIGVFIICLLLVREVEKKISYL